MRLKFLEHKIKSEWTTLQVENNYFRFGFLELSVLSGFASESSNYYSIESKSS